MMLTFSIDSNISPGLEQLQLSFNEINYDLSIIKNRTKDKVTKVFSALIILNLY